MIQNGMQQLRMRYPSWKSFKKKECMKIYRNRTNSSFKMFSSKPHWLRNNVNSLVLSSRICPIGMTGNSLNSNNWTNTMIKTHLVSLNIVPKVLNFYHYYGVILLKMMVERRPAVSVMETKTAEVLLPLQKHMQHLWNRQHLVFSGLQLLSTTLSR